MSVLYLDPAEYRLSDCQRADEFRDYAKETIDKIRNSVPVFLMDTSEADNIYKAYRLIGTLYPIAMVVALLLGGALPGMMVIQTVREASIMRVLGTTKKRTRIILILEQLILCLFGMIVALILLTALNGTAVLNIAKPLGFCALHIIGCAAGVVVCSVVITRRRILELLQVKE